MLRLFCSRFSTAANSFKNKSKLSEFYKAIHPDLLHNAPDNVKTENSRSLKILNAYFDAVAQNYRTEQQELIFFVANKSNTKARKFYPITVILDAYLQKNQEETIERIVKQLQSKVGEKQQEISKLHIKQSNKLMSINQDDYETVKSNFLSESTYIKKKSQQLLQEKLGERTQAFAAQNEQNFKIMEQQVQQQMKSIHGPHIKSRLWGQVTAQQSDFIPNIVQIFADLIDPRMIYLSDKLTDQQFEIFKKKLIPTLENRQYLTKMKSVFEQLEHANPAIYLYVTNSYGANDIPGYFSIPYNFEVDELGDQFMELKDSIIMRRKEYEAELQKYDDVLFRLVSTYMIDKLQNEIVMKNTEIIKQLNVSLLTLSNILSKIDSQRLNQLRMKQWVLTDRVTRITDVSDVLYIPIPYVVSYL